MKNQPLRYAALLLTAFLLNLPFIFSTPMTAVAGVSVNIRVLLKGALIGNNNSGLMRDDLRSQGVIPTDEPYSDFPRYYHVGANGGSEIIADGSVLQVSGPDAIVDWVFIELRDANDPAKILATRSGLLQRDGDVVDVDGVSPLVFETVSAGEYYVAVRHRNHLGVMTANAYELTETPILLDFTDPDFLTYGEDAQADFAGRMAMIGGDFNGDGKVIAIGPNNDIFYLFSSVLSAPENTSFNENYIYHGYHWSDYNLDGKAIFVGPNNDRSMVFYLSIGDCLTNNMPNCVLTEQLPK
jgi:hypothetical protein